MHADDFLLVLVRDPPRTLRAFEELAGPLHVDEEGREWFSVYRPRLRSDERPPFSKALDTVSVVLDYFRDEGPDPELQELRLVVRIRFGRAIKLLTRACGPPQDAVVEGAPARRFGDFCVRPFKRQVLLDWERPRASDGAPFDESVRRSFLAGLPQALAATTTAPRLRTAATPPPGAGARLNAQATERRLAGTTRVPLTDLALDPPMDAVELADLWHIERPVAVSTDVHQVMWSMQIAGDPIPDPHGPRIWSSDLRAGAWRLSIGLDGRPPGPLPRVSAGTSPAYDIRERGARAVRIELSPAD